MGNLYRLFSILALIFVFSLSGKCLMDTGESQEKLPVIINKGYKIVGENNIQALLEHEDRKPSPMGRLSLGAAILEKEKVDIDYGKISKLVSSIRDKLCSVNQEGSYEVWLQVEGGASLGVFVSASAQTGIKAIINCSAEHK